MASDTKSSSSSIKQLKVDNWATFFMQRLQLLFAKGDSCDITLKFFTGQELKVHSLVIRSCTNHFDTLPKVNNVIILPEALSYTAVFPIINFMYSGKLEFKPDLQQKLINIAKILNISILLKLLMAQKGDGLNGHPKFQSTGDGNKSSNISSNTPSTAFSLFSGKKLPFWRKRSLPIMKYIGRKPAVDEPGPTRFNWPENEPTDWLLIASPSFCFLSYHTEPIVKAPLKLELPPSPPLPPRRIIESRMVATHDSDDDDRFEDNYSSDEEPPLTPPPHQSASSLSPSTPGSSAVLKPCLKTPSSESPAGPPSKRVRFSLGPEGKENSSQTSASNHAKIIAEVLKKYPDLVKNKNIKLKISSPKPKADNGLVNDDRASYVVLRPTMRAGCSSTPTSHKSNEPNPNPWACDHCANVKFENYQEYRKHIEEAHGERIDAKMCEYCGYKASKRNLHLYHLYTKHNVPPPKHINFPKCSECSYIALSESLLTKHMNNHQIKDLKEQTKEMQCDVCKIVIKNQVALCAHKLTCKPENETRNMICELCKTPLSTTLSAHIKDCPGGNAKSGPTATLFSENGDQQPVEMIEVPIIEAVNMEKGDHTLVQIPSGLILADNQNMTLLPSGESEALASVATGIATSLGLTVSLPQDQQAVILLHGNSPDYIIPDAEFLETAGNIAYTTGQNQVIYLGSSPGHSGQQEVIQLEEIKINQTAPSTSSAQKKSLSRKGHEIVQTSLNERRNEHQNVIINVQGSLSQAASAQLEQSGLILINASKPVNANLHAVEQSGIQQNSYQNVVLALPATVQESTIQVDEQQLVVTDQLQDDSVVRQGSEPRGESALLNLTRQVKRNPTLNRCILQRNISLEGNILQRNTSLEHSTFQRDSSSESKTLLSNISLERNSSSSGNNLQKNMSLEGNASSEGNISSEENTIQISTSLDGRTLEVNSSLEVNTLQKDTSLEGSTLQMNTSLKSNSLERNTSPVNNSFEENTSLNENLPRGSLYEESDSLKDDIILKETGPIAQTNESESSRASVKIQIQDSVPEISHGENKLSIVNDITENEECDQMLTSSESCSLPANNSVIIDNKNPQNGTKIEQTKVTEKESKDEELLPLEPEVPMEVDSDERVDSLVKDWGFDDEDNEEVIDDPDCKPLRPDIDDIEL